MLWHLGTTELLGEREILCIGFELWPSRQSRHSLLWQQKTSSWLQHRKNLQASKLQSPLRVVTNAVQ